MKGAAVLAACGAALLLSAPAAGAATPPPPPSIGEGQSKDGSATATLTEGAPVQAAPVSQPRRGTRPAVTFETFVAQGPCIPDVEGADPIIYNVVMTPPGVVVDSYCGARPPAAPVVDLDDLTGTAETVLARVTPDLPALTVQPGTRALVNAPVVMSVGNPTGALSDSAVNPLSQRTVTVRLAEPTYRWDFGDGTAANAGPGRAWTGGDVPAEGRGTPYVSHTYRGPAAVTVTVTATYAASFTVAGLGTFDLDPLSITGTASLDVVQARTELVAG